MKIALLLAYDGTEFRGFARQPAVRTVQGELDARLTALLGEPVRTVGAGRTDAGVHAAGQVVSFPVPAGTDPEWVRARLNRWIAPEVVVRGAAKVPEDFDARFSAVRREYEYRCYVAADPDPFRERFALQVGERPGLAAMRAEASALVGLHDFSAFCRKGPGKPVRRVRALTIRRVGDSLTFTVKADSFCQQMVRAIVGLMLAVGSGARASGDVSRVLASRARDSTAPVAPARGLHLVRVQYPRDPFA